MTDVVVDTFEELDLEDALVVVAFPTTGSAAPIAAHFLVKHLALPLVGQLRIKDMVGVAAIQDGIATSPVRIYGGKVECKLEKQCPHIYLVTTEVPLPQEWFGDLAEAILDTAGDGRAQLVLALEGVVRQEDDDTPDVYIAGATRKALELLKTTGMEPAGRAVIASLAGQLLLAARRDGVPVGVMLVEASAKHPDGRAAAALISALDKLVPEVDVDAEPLRAEAMELEAQIRKAQEAAQGSASRSYPATTFV